MTDINEAWDETIGILRSKGYSLAWILSSREVFELGWRAHEFEQVKNEKTPHIDQVLEPAKRILARTETRIACDRLADN